MMEHQYKVNKCGCDLYWAFYFCASLYRNMKVKYKFLISRFFIAQKSKMTSVLFCINKNNEPHLFLARVFDFMSDYHTVGSFNIRKYFFDCLWQLIRAYCLTQIQQKKFFNLKFYTYYKFLKNISLSTGYKWYNCTFRRFQFDNICSLCKNHWFEIRCKQSGQDFSKYKITGYLYINLSLSFDIQSRNNSRQI